MLVTAPSGGAGRFVARCVVGVRGEPLREEAVGSAGEPEEVGLPVNGAGLPSSGGVMTGGRTAKVGMWACL